MTLSPGKSGKLRTVPKQVKNLEFFLFAQELSQFRKATSWQLYTIVQIDRLSLVSAGCITKHLADYASRYIYNKLSNHLLSITNIAICGWTS